MNSNRVYLDYHATTPLDARVLEAMKPYLLTEFGNPGSKHAYGWPAKDAVEKARRQVAQLIGANPTEIIFTSGATEANNIALFGSVKQGGHYITTAVEHKSVLNCFEEFKKLGLDVTILKVDGDGLISFDELQRAIKPNTKLVSVIMANNEIGTIQDRKSTRLNSSH